MKKLAVTALASLSLFTALGAQAAVATRLLGDVVPTTEATRTVVITPQTRHVNVALGEVVKFESGGQAFAVNFDGPNTMAFDLQRLAPAGALEHRVMAYVAPSGEDTGHGPGRGR